MKAYKVRCSIKTVKHIDMALYSCKSEADKHAEMENKGHKTDEYNVVEVEIREPEYWVVG